jgi:peptidoglycan/LPS O-acetylase OafA/YrhL
VAPYDVLAQPVFAFGFAAVVAGAVLDRRRGRIVLPRPIVRSLAWAGLWSYSLYLLHPAVLELVDRRSHLGTGPRLLLGWAASLVVSWLFYLLVERRWLRRAQRTRLTAPATPFPRDPLVAESPLSVPSRTL